MNKLIAVLPNLDALKNYTPPESGKEVCTVQTLGYKTEGDQGGLLWYYDPNDKESCARYPFVVIGANCSRWKPVNLTYITPEMFGAKGAVDPHPTAASERDRTTECDDETPNECKKKENTDKNEGAHNCKEKHDDREAIQAAIDAAKSPWVYGDNYMRHGSVKLDNCRYHNGITLKLHGLYYIGGPLYIDENIIIDARVTLYLLDRDDNETWDHVIEITRNVEITGSISVRANNKAKSLLKGYHLAESTLPDIYADGFTGFAIDISRVTGDESKEIGNANNNNVRIGTINAKRCGLSGIMSYKKEHVSTDKNKKGYKISVKEITDKGATPEKRQPLDRRNSIEFLYCIESNTAHSIINYDTDDHITVYPDLKDESGTLIYYSGGVLNLEGTAGIWDIRGISAINCPGIAFLSQCYYGATLHKLHIERTGCGIIFGNQKNEQKPVNCNASLVLNPYFESSRCVIESLRHLTAANKCLSDSEINRLLEDIRNIVFRSNPTTIPFLICGGSTATIIEPWDSTPYETTYLKLGDHSDGRYSIVRGGEVAATFPREETDRSTKIIARSDQRLILKKKKSGNLVTPIEIRPYLPTSEVDIFLLNYVNASVILSISSDGDYANYTINGNPTPYTLTPPNSGDAHIRIICTNGDFKVLVYEIDRAPS